jgi:hypothetical protein
MAMHWQRVALGRLGSAMESHQPTGGGGLIALLLCLDPCYRIVLINLTVQILAQTCAGHRR